MYFTLKSTYLDVSTGKFFLEYLFTDTFNKTDYFLHKYLIIILYNILKIKSYLIEVKRIIHTNIHYFKYNHCFSSR